MVVRRKIAGIGITVGIIIAAIFIAKKFNLGGQIIEGFGGFGETIGQSILAIPRGIISGGAAGAGGLAIEAINISEAFQKFVNQGKLFSEPQSTSLILPKAEGAISFPQFDITDLFSEFETRRRIVESINRAQSGTAGTPFGGFAGAVEQETALQKAIRESAEKFSQFFIT